MSEALVEQPKTEERENTQLTRLPDGKFVKGFTANKGGRPKGLAALVREQTDDGKELVRLMWEIAQGTLFVTDTYYDATGKERKVDKEPSHRDREAAIEWLADRGWGKPSQSLDVTSGGNSIVIVPFSIPPNEVSGRNN